MFGFQTNGQVLSLLEGWKRNKQDGFQRSEPSNVFNVLNASPLKKLQVQIVSLPLIVFIHFLFDL